MALGIVIYVLLTIVLFYAATVFVLKRLSIRGVADSIVAVSIVAISQQVLTGWVLGLFGRLFAVEYLCANSIISVLLLLFSFPGRSDWLGPFRLIARLVRSLWKLCRHIDIFLIFILDLILLALLLARGIIYPPHGWDDLGYHLGEVGFMLQDGNLGFLPRYPLETYPRNIELTYFYNAVFIHHQVHLNCLQIPYILLATFACYGILRKAGCRRRPSAFAALTFPTLPIVIQQAGTAYIDIAISAVLLCGINFLAQTRMRLSHIILAGLAFGILAGGKGSGVLLAGGAIIAWLVLGCWGLIRKLRLRRYIGWVIVLIIAILLNGSWVYVRNWVVFKNPVHPYIVKIGNRVLFEGTVKFESHISPELLGEDYSKLRKSPWPGRMYYSWSEPKPFISFDSRTGGFGPLFFILFLPAAAASVIISLIQRRRRFLFTVVLITAPLISIYSLAFWCRYAIFLSAAGMAGFAYISGIIGRYRGRYLLHFAVFALALVSSFFFFRVPNLDSENKGLAHFLDKGPNYWHSSQFSTGGLFQHFFRQVYPYEKPGTVILIDNSFKHFRVLCLWNLDFSNRVVYVKADTREEWLEAIDESGADYVLVGKEGESYKWLKKHPRRFETLVADKEFVFCRVKPPMPGHPP